MTRDEIISEIERHARIIVAHRTEPCEFWTGSGCEAAMVHDAEDILDLVAKLRSVGENRREQSAEALLSDEAAGTVAAIIENRCGVVAGIGPAVREALSALAKNQEER